MVISLNNNLPIWSHPLQMFLCSNIDCEFCLSKSELWWPVLSRLSLQCFPVQLNPTRHFFQPRHITTWNGQIFVYICSRKCMSVDCEAPKIRLTLYVHAVEGGSRGSHQERLSYSRRQRRKFPPAFPIILSSHSKHVAGEDNSHLAPLGCTHADVIVARRGRGPSVQGERDLRHRESEERQWTCATPGLTRLLRRL